jgi:hypothetical protein
MSLSNLDKLLGVLTITSKEFSFPLNYILLAAAFLFFYGIFYGAHLVVSGLALFWEL